MALLLAALVALVIAAGVEAGSAAPSGHNDARYAYDQAGALTTGAVHGYDHPRNSLGEVRVLSDSIVAARVGVPSGLKDASPGLRKLFEDGTIRDRSIIGIRSTLTENGFASQQLTKNRRGYLFQGLGGEQVRVM